MVRGTDATFKFQIPYSFLDLATATISFWQNGNNGPTQDRPLPIIKVLEQCSQGEYDNELQVKLTPEETLRFTEDLKAYAQIRAVTIEGNTFASKQQEITIYPIYDESLILGDVIVPTPSFNNGEYILDGGNILD